MAKFRQKRFLIPVLIVVILLLLVAGFNEYAYRQEAQGLYGSDILKSEPYDAVIVLGGDVTNDGSITQFGRTRMDKALDLYHERKVVKIIVGGGAVNPRVAKSEARTMYEYALRNGVPESDIITEERASSTVGNAYYVKTSILEPNGWRNNIVITSDFHMTRAKQVFSKVLGEGYVTAYLASGQELSPIEVVKIPVRERAYYLLQKVLFLGIRDGDHEQIRNRFEFLHLPIGMPLGAARRYSLPLSNKWPHTEISFSGGRLF